ncbi:MAG: excinuclease ABC subunit UvrC [Anaplasmataceae bacterium]|nr:excinuclease ABC subunit UvrC [Anaplasmataceae bacterium]
MPNFDLETLANFPKEPGVYLMKDVAGKILYIGKAKNLKHRLRQYFAKSGDTRSMIPFLTAEVASIDTIVLTNEKQALLLENTLIKKHQPKYNALLKDDKTFINLFINKQHPWPMIRLMRYKGTPKEKGLYFGPYPHAMAARETLDLLNHLFPLRQCSDEELKKRTRPCILHSMQRCIAPCVGKCTKEEYDLFVEGAIRFLRGQDKEILKSLQADMEDASNHLEFERAAALFRTIQQIELLLSPDQLIAKATGQSTDVLAVYRHGYDAVLMQLLWREGKLIGAEHYEFSKIAEDEQELLSTFILQNYKTAELLPHEILLSHPIEHIDALSETLNENSHKKIHLLFPKKGEKRQLIEIGLKNAKIFFTQKKDQRETNEKLLIDLTEICKLTRYPKKIECFDTSNIAGSEHVACMVGFTEGVRDKQRTRLFHIKEAQAGDDYGALREILTRRLIKAKEQEDLPDLLIVDGGKGQLHVALDVLHALDIASIDVLGIAKETARHDKGLTKEKIFLPYHPEPILLDARAPLLFFLQRIRDEAHRIAIGFHRKSKKKNTLKSGLDTLPGIGPIKKERLLRHFGSLKQISLASEEDLLKVQGLTKQDLATLKKLRSH